MRKFILITTILTMSILTGIVYAEEAAVLPENNLRLSQSHNFGFVDEGASVSWGFGAEYSTSNWLSLQLFADTFLNPQPYAGSGSIFFGLKGYIMGEGALAPIAGEWLRFTTALGILFPPASEPDRLNQDQKLWGSALRIHSDFIFVNWFFLNLYFEGVYYPLQHSSNEAFYGERVAHYLDLTWELEFHFVIALESGVVLKCGVPVRFFYAPWMNETDEHARNQYLLSAGTYFGVTLPNSAQPLELYLRYNAHILGRNIRQVHNVSLITSVTLPSSTFKFLRSKDDE